MGNDFFPGAKCPEPYQGMPNRPVGQKKGGKDVAGIPPKKEEKNEDSE